MRTVFTLIFIKEAFIDEGYEPVLRSFSEQGKNHNIVAHANLTTLNGENAKNWAMTMR